MKYFTYLVVAVIIVTAGYYLYESNYNSSTISYVATVVDEVAQLEIELAELERAVSRGELTEERAAEAKAAIVTRLESIVVQTQQAEEGSGITAAQKEQLMGALSRLKNTLNTYANTLVEVEGVVAGINISTAPERVRRFVNKSNKPLQSVVTDTVSDVEESVEVITDEALPEAVTDIELDAVFDEIPSATSSTTEDMMNGTSTNATSTLSVEPNATSSTTTTDVSDEAEEEPAQI